MPGRMGVRGMKVLYVAAEVPETVSWQWALPCPREPGPAA
jgi:hypothetical protein